MGLTARHGNGCGRRCLLGPQGGWAGCSGRTWRAGRPPPRSNPAALC